MLNNFFFNSSALWGLVLAKIFPEVNVKRRASLYNNLFSIPVLNQDD